MAKEAPDVSSCIKDSSTVLTDVKTAMELLKIGGFENVKKALGLLGDSLHELETAMGDCKAGGEELAKVIAAFKDPKGMIYHAGKELIVHHTEIFTEMKAAYEAYEATQYEVCGEDVGDAVAKLLIGMKAEAVVADTKHDVGLFFEGVLKGFMAKEAPDVSSCIKDSSTVLTDVKTAMELLKIGGFENVKKALGLLGDSLHELETAMGDCKAGGEELAKVIAAFKDPKGMIYHAGKELIVHHTEIFAEMKAAYEAFEATQYEECGEDVGEVVGKLLVEIDSEELAHYVFHAD